MEYTPSGRPSAFTLPELSDQADLQVILANLANDCINIAGDDLSGDFTVTGIWDASDLRKGGVAVITAADSVEISNKVLTTGNSIKAGNTLVNAGTISGGTLASPTISSPTVSGGSWANPTFSGSITGLPAANLTILAKSVSYTPALVDAQALIWLNAATAQKIMIPTNAAVAFPIGTSIIAARGGAGALSFEAVTPGTTTVVGTPSLSLRAQYSIATAIKISADVWCVAGDVA